MERTNEVKTYPRPAVFDFRSDAVLNRIFVSIPILTTPIDHSTFGTLKHVSMVARKQNETQIKAKLEHHSSYIGLS